MASGVLGGWPHVEHQHLTAGEPDGQLVATDDLDPFPAAQVGVGEPVQAGHVLGRRLRQCRPQVGDPVAGQRVEDSGAVAAGRHQPGPRHCPQVMGGIRHALADLAGDLLDRALTLGQQVCDLRPPPARQRPGNLGETLVQCVFRRAVSHAFRI